MKKKEIKTNAVRLLEQKKMDFALHDYTDTEALSGTEVAAVLDENPDRVFKTLVTAGKSGEHYVFLVPVNRELDLKKGAAAVGEKNIAMIKSKELLPLTGYIHGGCSPIGMKKFFTTTVDESALNFEKIFFSAGRIGCQIEMKIADLDKIIEYKTADITE